MLESNIDDDDIKRGVDDSIVCDDWGIWCCITGCNISTSVSTSIPYTWTAGIGCLLNRALAVDGCTWCVIDLQSTKVEHLFICLIIDDGGGGKYNCSMYCCCSSYLELAIEVTELFEIAMHM